MSSWGDIAMLTGMLGFIAALLWLDYVYNHPRDL